MEFQVSTLTTSTAIPFQITMGANGPAGAAAPNVLSISAAGRRRISFGFGGRKYRRGDLTSYRRGLGWRRNDRKRWTRWELFLDRWRGWQREVGTLQITAGRAVELPGRRARVERLELQEPRALAETWCSASESEESGEHLALRVNFRLLVQTSFSIGYRRNQCRDSFHCPWSHGRKYKSRD